MCKSTSSCEWLARNTQHAWSQILWSTPRTNVCTRTDDYEFMCQQNIHSMASHKSRYVCFIVPFHFVWVGLVVIDRFYSLPIHAMSLW